MKVSVDPSACQRYGHCCFEAPEVFQLDDDGELHHLTDVDDTHAPKVEAAVRACPMLAITATAP
jgi:ferredoxin